MELIIGIVSPHLPSSRRNLLIYLGSSRSVDAWPLHLQKLLISNATDGKRPLLDSVIDSAGGDICSKALKILKPGGRIVCYGM